MLDSLAVSCCPDPLVARRQSVVPRLRAARGLDPQGTFGAVGVFGAEGSSSELGRGIAQVLLQAAGGAGGALASDLLHDPEVQAELQRLTGECKTRAKAGVSEFLAESWPWFVVGFAGITAMQYLITMAALVQSGVTRVRRLHVSTSGAGRPGAGGLGA